MKNYFIILISAIFLSMIMLMSCQKEETATKYYPRFITEPVTGITSAEATFSSKIISGDLSGVTAYGFCWNMFVEPKLDAGDSLVVKEPLTAKSFSRRVQTLRSNQIYYLRSFIRTDKALIYGTVVTFKTLN